MRLTLFVVSHATRHSGHSWSCEVKGVKGEAIVFTFRCLLNLTPVVVAFSWKHQWLGFILEHVYIRVVIAELFYHIDTAIYSFVLICHLKVIWTHLANYHALFVLCVCRVNQGNNGEIFLLCRSAKKHLGPSLCCFLATISQPLQVRWG